MNEQTKHRMTAIFNEWARRYAENPDAFSPILDANGKPVEDYGQQCTRYFDEIAFDLEKAEILTQVRETPLKSTPHNVKDKEYLSRAASLVQALLPDNHLFFLLIAPVGSNPNNRLSYTASMQMDDARNVMKEFLIKSGDKSDWLKHI